MATRSFRRWVGAIVLSVWMAGCQPAEPVPTAIDKTAPAPAAPVTAGADGYPERWNYIGAKLGDDKGCDEFIDRLKQSAAVHCTHIMMPEGRWMRFADDQAYRARVEKIKKVAAELHLTIVPCVVSIGYSGRYFHYDANLAAGIPVKDLLYTVKDGKGTPDASEQPDVNDLAAEADGTRSGMLKVKPFHHYRIWVTADKAAKVEINGRSLEGKRNNILTNARSVKQDGDSALWVTSFNSLDADQVKVQIGVKEGAIREVKIENAGMLLIVRRPLVPLTVTGADGKTVYEEGRDFETIIDPCLKKNPYDGETTNDHAPAEIVLTPDSRIQNGDQLKLSFWHTVRIYDDQDCISLEDPRTFEIYENEFKNCMKVWNASAYVLNYDEIRIGGWEPMPGGKTMKPGELLAWHFKKNYDMVRKHAPQAALYTWSDMFTPYHNARPFEQKGYYYLVNGNYDNSWVGLPKDVGILNWYSPEVDGVKFFADLGYKQILCGYYDVNTTAKLTEGIEKWKRVSAGQPGILGFMYTTWSAKYKLLEEFFQILDAHKEAASAGASGEPAAPQAEPGVPAGH